MEKKLYDIHCHLFDLSHANLLAFMSRDDLITKDSVKKVLNALPWYLNIPPIGLTHLFCDKIAKAIRETIKEKGGGVKNLLSVMESAIEYDVLYLEYFLLNRPSCFSLNKTDRYNKLVITPLIMDFGFKNLQEEDYFYNMPPCKPIANQVVDLLNAIYFYYHYDLEIHPDKPNRLKLIPIDFSKESLEKVKERKLMEVYPFLGINTQNYELAEIVALFDKYFKGYEDDTLKQVRKSKLYSKMGTIKADLEELLMNKPGNDNNSVDYTYLFAGIKLYPPLGFDPWPDDNPAELAKVKYLYDECLKRKLPITVHCSDGGFITDKNSEKYTNPAKQWSKVLSQPQYNGLTINFAHLGNQKSGQTDWLKAITSFMSTNKNVYTDCSSVTPTANDYGKVGKLMTPEQEKRILFGTDFVINLVGGSASYNEYFNNAMVAKGLTSQQKELLMVHNPEDFLFG